MNQVFITLIVQIFIVLKYKNTVTQENYPEFRMHSKGQDVEIHDQVTVSESFPVPFLQHRGSLQKVLKLLDLNYFAHHLMTFKRAAQEPEIHH